MKNVRILRLTPFKSFAKSRFRRQIDSNLFYPKIEFPIINTRGEHGFWSETAEATIGA